MFKPDEFVASGIELCFLKTILEPYPQKRNDFVPGLSIIDVMMWNSFASIRIILDDYYSITSSPSANDINEIKNYLFRSAFKMCDFIMFDNKTKHLGVTP